MGTSHYRRRFIRGRQLFSTLASIVSLLCSGCGSFRASRADKEATRTWSIPHLEQQVLSGKPNLVSLSREGDPQGAVALVLAGGGATDDSPPQLAALLSARLSGNGTSVEVIPRLEGVTIVATANDAPAISRLVSQLNAAISTPVSRGELETARYRQEFARLSQGDINGRERCSNLSRRNAERRDRNLAELEELRGSFYSSNNASWGLVGQPTLLEAAVSAIRSLDTWPRRDSATHDWPSDDHIALSVGQKQDVRLRITWRLPAYTTALAAEREIAASSTPLAQGLSAMPSALRVECVRAMPLKLGSQLELSIRPEAHATTATIEELLTATRVAVNELRLLRNSGSDKLAVLATVEQPNPKWAAEMSAWISLSNAQTTNADHFDVDIEIGSEHPRVGLVPQLVLADAIRKLPHAATLPVVSTTEPGQGSVSALIASPCAAWNETIRSVGATALAIRTLAARHHDFSGISLEPWVTPEGIGLIGRARRMSASETSENVARRLGDTLGRALTTWRLESSNVWSVRHETLARLGTSPRPALWQALSTIAGRAPAIVLPDGTFTSVEGVSLSELSERRLGLLRMPLRLAVIENSPVVPPAEDSQANVVRSALWRWLAPYRSDIGECPSLSFDSKFESGETRIDPRWVDPDDATVTAAAVLPSSDARDEGHAVVLLNMLTGQNGWLAARLREANVPGTIDARIVGGGKRRGIVIVVGVTISGIDAAVRIIRSALQDLGSTTALSSFVLDQSIATLVQSNRIRRADPRARLEDAWLGRSLDSTIEAKSFGDYLKRAFLPGNLVIVRSEPAAAPAKH